jgi:hypothetical protein
VTGRPEVETAESEKGVFLGSGKFGGGKEPGAIDCGSQQTTVRVLGDNANT